MGQRRAKSDSAYKQDDQGFRCPQLPEDIFSHGAVYQYYILSQILILESIFSCNMVNECRTNWESTQRF